MGKYNIWVDPGAEASRKLIWGQADKANALADSLETTSDLDTLGKQELAKVLSGRMGSTMFGSALQNQSARAIQQAKNSYASTPGLSGYGPNTDLIWKRALQKRIGQIQDNNADILARSMPGYVGQAGAWANTNNQLKLQKQDATAQVSNLYNQGWEAQRSGTIYDKKASVWEKIGNVLKVGAGIAAGAMTGGLGGALLGGIGTTGNVLSGSGGIYSPQQAGGGSVGNIRQQSSGSGLPSNMVDDTAWKGAADALRKSSVVTIPYGSAPSVDFNSSIWG